MTVPSNLVPTSILQLTEDPSPSSDAWMMYVHNGNTYKVQVSAVLNVSGVPTSRTITAGTGLTGGGDLTVNRTISVANGGIGSTQLDNTGVTPGVYGSASELPILTVDANGRVTAATTTPFSVSGFVPTSRQVIAGTGLTGGGALTANVTISNVFSSATPLALGAAAAGTATVTAREDHVHPAVNLASLVQTTGVLGMVSGGTGVAHTAPAAGSVAYSDGSGIQLTTVGLAGQVLVSAGASPPDWGSALIVSDQLANVFYGGPTSGPAAPTAFRTLVNADLPASGVTANTYGSTLTVPVVTVNSKGVLTSVTSATITATVSSVGLSLPAQFSVSSSPVTTTGTLTASWVNQTANTMFAGPATGADTTPTFRAMVNADLPASGVVASTYGSPTEIPILTVNSKGVLTGVTTTTITTGLSYQGSWNASTNTPTLASGVGTNGYYYIVSVAGSTNLDGITDWALGDWAIFNGTAWQKIDQSNTVASVNGYTGVVVLNYADVGAQPLDAQLTDIAGLTPADNNIIIGNGTNFVTESGATARTSLGAAASGANADITGMTGLTNGITTPDYITFDTTPETVPTAPGSLYWDSADGNQTLSLIMANSDATQQIGQETYYRIKASSAITEGQVVMFTGTVGASGALTGAPATGLTGSTAMYVMGVATQNIALNGWGYVTAFGLVRQIDTTGGAEAWVDGEILYYNPAVTGGLTKTAPTAPNAKIQVCAVVYAAANGSLFIRPTFGGILGQYEGDVGFTSTAAYDLIQRNAANTAWVNVATIPNTQVSGLGTMSTQAASAVAITGGAINGTTIGATTAAAGTFTTCTATSFSGIDGGTF